ncbi:prolipoprotein diacylglyceryl transferase [Mesomycoplasma neurolyticum]|uniref:Prolipoprotein diacylglyceryl transferase n=1 Tax=Mesomycoplasma neurolyticum TaxID=2120 RepID=A0A449A499_9BACT|nr:prolipoprotein diacylglyceryl transferase [Mesomycoplasma neurolyticum]VEU59075.1 Prolipoprotein diacylglyceryl transferase [Mesomycoplasma neurolyticum]
MGLSSELLAKAPFLKDARPFQSGEAFWLIKGAIPIYSFMIFLGIIASIISIFFFWKREKLSLEHLYWLIIITVPTAIIGARLGFIFEQIIAGNAASLKNNWWNPRDGGLSVQWGVMISASCDLIYVMTKRKVLDYRKAMSYILPTILIGQAIGRWGNFTNHELYGKVDSDGSTVLWLGESIVKNMYIRDSVNTDGALRVPLFFYEFLTSIIGYILIVWILNLFNWLKPGTTGALYFVWYGIVRSSMEFLRQESYVFYFVISILYIIFGLTFASYYQFLGNYRFNFKEKKLEKVIRYKSEKRKWLNINWNYYQKLY